MFNGNTNTHTSGSLSNWVKTHYREYLIDNTAPCLGNDHFNQKNSGSTTEFRSAMEVVRRKA